MDQRLRGKIALVTGAGRGIGEAIARRLAAEGARVWIADIDEARGKEVAASIDGSAFAPVDISKDESVADLAAEVEAKDGKLDVLVNNAAILDMTSYKDLTIDTFVRVQDINLVGTLRMTMAMVPLMRKAGGGRILNMASVNGLRGSRDSLSYSTAKGGIVNLTRLLASELSVDNITVNAIAPGFIATRMSVWPDGTVEHESDWFKYIYIDNRRIPLARGGQPDDIAGPAFFFCSDDSRYVTGQILPVDGGMLSTF